MNKGYLLKSFDFNFVNPDSRLTDNNSMYLYKSEIQDLHFLLLLYIQINLQTNIIQEVFFHFLLMIVVLELQIDLDMKLQV